MGVSLARALNDALEEGRALVPQGEAWPRDPRSNLDRTLGGLAAWRGRVEVRADELLAEADPRTATELLPEWEEAVGLPDECLPAPETLADRRGLVVSRLVGAGGGTRAFFVDLANALGYAVTISEGTSAPFRAGQGRAGESLGGELDWFVWTVEAPLTLVRRATAGVLRAGEPLATWGNELLECVLRRASPAHTLVRFVYGATCWLELYDEHGDPLTVYQVGEAIVVIDSSGGTVTITVEGGEIVARDENGDPVGVPITCEA